MRLHVNSWDAYNRALDQAKIRVAIDIGANDSGYTSTLVEHGFEVYSFEPNPAMFAKLQAAFGNHPKVHCFSYGVGDVEETIKGVQTLEAWTIGKPGDGGLQPTPNKEAAGIFDMDIKTIDSMFKNIPVGIIKLDTDGHEFKVLRGAEKTIRRDMPPILCEFGCYLHKLGESPEAFVNFIFGLGYKVVSCDGKNEFLTWEQIEPQWPWHTTFDVVLLPR